MKFNPMSKKKVFQLLEISVVMELVRHFMSHLTYYTMGIKIQEQNLSLE